MADNSIMTNISAVQNYGKDLDRFAKDLRRLFNDLEKRTDAIGNIWKDDQFKKFHEEFKQNIKKYVLESATKMELQANYISKIIELQRQIQQTKNY